MIATGSPTDTLRNVNAVLDVLGLLPVTHLQSDDDGLGLALLLQTCSKAIEAAQRDMDKMELQRKITAVSAPAALTFNPPVRRMAMRGSGSSWRMAEQVAQRNPNGMNQVVLLMDGQESLWRAGWT
ncbi:MAG: hypothetical protein WCA32_01315 [Chromatiaceae bacterium]